MSLNILLLLTAILDFILCQSTVTFSPEAVDPLSNPIRLMERRHLIRGRGIHKEKMHSNVNNGYLQWEKDKFHEALGEKILPKSSRTQMDPKFLGSVEPRLLKSTSDGERTKSDSEEAKWRNWLRRHFFVEKIV